MKIEGCLALLWQLSLSLALRRGPHHPHGQQPVDHQHHHYTPRGAESLTQEEDVLRDAKHIEEDSAHLTAEMVAQMSPEELEFHYFQAHDFDRNNQLDGLEMLKAVYHMTEHNHNPDTDKSIEPESNEIVDYVALVDKTLALDDTDNDGYISYLEYRKARLHDPKGRTHRVLAED